MSTEKVCKTVRYVQMGIAESGMMGTIPSLSHCFCAGKNNFWRHIVCNEISSNIIPNNHAASSSIMQYSVPFILFHNIQISTNLIPSHQFPDIYLSVSSCLTSVVVVVVVVVVGSDTSPTAFTGWVWVAVGFSARLLLVWVPVLSVRKTMIRCPLPLRVEFGRPSFSSGHCAYGFGWLFQDI